MLKVGLQIGEKCSPWGPTTVADTLFFLLPHRAAKVWAPFLSGPLGTEGEKGTTAPVTVTPTASTPSL